MGEKISVVVPVYNSEKYINDFFCSIINQTYKNFELFFVNDGSTDNSLNLLKDFRDKNKDMDVKVISQANFGLSVARNKGILLSSSDFIIFPDPDDWLEPKYLELLLESHHKYNSDLEICNFNEYDGKKIISRGNPKNTVLSQATAMENMLDNSSFRHYVTNKLFHMDIIRKYKLKFYPELLSLQDMIFCYEYLYFCQKISYVGKPLYNYRLYSGVSNEKDFVSTRKLTGLKALHSLKTKAIVNGDTFLYEKIRNKYTEYLREIISICMKHNIFNEEIIKEVIFAANDIATFN